MRIFSIIIICGALTIGCRKDRVVEQYHNGRAIARADLTKGVLAIASTEDTQLPPCWFYYDGLLRTNYGVRRIVYSLPDPQAAEAWARGYNEVGLPEIEQRFGTNVLKRTMTEAQAMYDGIHERKKKKTDL